jgi:hypothetical protein
MVILQLLCVGVGVDWWGPAAPANVLENAHSPRELAKVCFWNDKDNGRYFAEYVKPMLKQLYEIEDSAGFRTSSLMLMPWKLVRLGSDETDQVLTTSPPPMVCMPDLGTGRPL